VPFTIAHPAAILPLRNRLTVTAALVIGSMAPDFEYLLRARIASTASHTVPGLVTFCLPVGLLVYVVARALREAFIQLMPSPLRARTPLNEWPDVNVAVLGSLLVGATTHLVWDSFTHRNGWGVAALGYGLVRLHGLPLYNLLQHASTAFGGVALLHAIARAPVLHREAADLPPSGVTRRTLAVAAPVAGSLTIVWSVIAGASLGNSVVRVIDVLVGVAMIAALQVKSRLRSTRV
jgi:tetrahydromethanopterin S-methyltransferase subunit C